MSTLIAMFEHLSGEFDTRSMPADRYIGLDIIRNRTERTIHLSQLDYIKGMAVSR